MPSTLIETSSRPSPQVVGVEGLPNFRDLGGYPSAKCPGRSVRRGLIYRSADPSRISELGIARLRQLRIAKVFDLRSHGEIEKSTKNGWGQIREWDQVPRVPVPVFPDDFYKDGRRAERDIKLRQEGNEGYLSYYQDILTSACSPENTNRPFGQIFAYLADTPAHELEPILIHCSLGKDRTGVISALILSLCGVDSSLVAHEYALSSSGLKEKIAAIVKEMRPDGPGLSEEESRFFGSRKESMQHFLDWIGGSNGVENYLIEKGVLTRSQVERLQATFVV
ncbi:tyrosine phosphatase [Fusarium tjaetaba]|uniref:Tyrosine phosphatase n=1 Tax=Fusarium tjaetaba TaxID=1567544 RepID=A0A8H5SB46_9HYPO|nr:tyrosine phosphatase [Fusarium tjaetaba]KAF5649811.1 tyrosine phosphatase [Fusarium tjaetaba]